MRRRFACWLCALLPLAAAQALEVDVARDGTAFVVRAEAVLQADRRSAWLTVTDYERLPDFVPDLTEVKVLARAARGGGERLLIEYSGEFRWLWFRAPVRVWLEAIHEAPRRVQARSVLPSGIGAGRSTLREFEGTYELEPIDGATTRLVHRARIEPAQPLLPLLGSLAVRHTAQAQFRALVAEIERRAARGRLEQAAR